MKQLCVHNDVHVDRHHKPAYEHTTSKNDYVARPVDLFGRAVVKTYGAVLAWLVPAVDVVLDDDVHVQFLLGHHIPPCGLQCTVYAWVFSGSFDARVLNVEHLGLYHDNNFAEVVQRLDKLYTKPPAKVDNMLVFTLDESMLIFNALNGVYRHIHSAHVGP
jgi:hypothetical protein